MHDIEPSVFQETDDFWIVLLVLGCFMFISSITAIVVLYLLWHRYQTRTQFNNESKGNIQDRQPEIYETQKIEVFVPPNEGDITQQNMDEFYPRTNKAYF